MKMGVKFAQKKIRDKNDNYVKNKRMKYKIYKFLKN